MNALVQSASCDLWNRDVVYAMVLDWLAGDGAKIMKLPSSQVANLGRFVFGVTDPKDLLPADGGKPNLLGYWLADAAKRGDWSGKWGRLGEDKPVADEIPKLFARVLKETLENPALPENRAFHSIWPGQADEEITKERKLAVLHETMMALVKSHPAHYTGKEQHDEQ